MTTVLEYAIRPCWMNKRMVSKAVLAAFTSSILLLLTICIARCCLRSVNAGDFPAFIQYSLVLVTTLVCHRLVDVQKQNGLERLRRFTARVLMKQVAAASVSNATKPGKRVRAMAKASDISRNSQHVATVPSDILVIFIVVACLCLVDWQIVVFSMLTLVATCVVAHEACQKISKTDEFKPSNHSIWKLTLASTMFFACLRAFSGILTIDGLIITFILVSFATASSTRLLAAYSALWSIQDQVDDLKSLLEPSVVQASENHIKQHPGPSVILSR